jgi:hypothetical protein
MPCVWFDLPCYLIYNQSWKTVSDGDALVDSVGMVLCSAISSPNVCLDTYIYNVTHRKASLG